MSLPLVCQFLSVFNTFSRKAVNFFSGIGSVVPFVSSTVTGNMTVYATFFTKIKNVDLELKRPEPGARVTCDEEGNQNIVPEVIIAENQHCGLYGTPKWAFGNYDDNAWENEGAFRAGEACYAEIMLCPDFGYWLDSNTAVTASGAAVKETSGGMIIFTILETKPLPILGDTNGDGKLNIRDVTAIQRHIDESEALTGDGFAAADINGDGVTDIGDATLLQRYFAEYIAKLK